MVNIHLGFGRQRTAAVVDVSPGGASAAIISVRNGQRSNIYAVGKSALSLEDRTDDQARAVIASQVEEACSQASRAYERLGHSEPITEAYIFMHAPWAKTHMVSGEHLYDANVRVQSAHIAEIVKEAIGSSKDIDLRNLLEGSVVRVDLNGYPTKEPEGKDAERIRVIAIATEADAQLKNSIAGAVHRSFPVARPQWRTALRAYLRIVRNLMQKDSCLIVDVGTDDTHLVAVHDGALEQLIIPEGTRTILKRVASGRPPEEVLGYMRMLSRDACSSEACDALRQSIATTEPELVRIFGEAMAKMATAQKIPNDVLLVASPDLDTWLSAFLSRIDFAQFSLTSLPLAVQSASTLEMSGWVTGDELVGPHALESVLVNIEAQE